MPPSVVGRTTLQYRPPLRHAERLTRLAEGLRHELQHLLRRAGDERQHDDRERERGDQRALLEPQHEQPVDEDPDHDRGDAVEDVQRRAHDHRATGRRRTRSRRSRSAPRSATPSQPPTAMSTTEPTMAFWIPPPLSPKVAWFLVNRSKLRAGIALTTTEPTMSREQRDREDATPGRSRARSPGSTACAAGRDRRWRGAGPVPGLRSRQRPCFSSKRLTMICAETLTTRMKTSRIAAQ